MPHRAEDACGLLRDAGAGLDCHHPVLAERERPGLFEDDRREAARLLEPTRSRTRSPERAPSGVEIAMTSGIARPSAWGTGDHEDRRDAFHDESRRAESPHAIAVNSAAASAADPQHERRTGPRATGRATATSVRALSWTCWSARGRAARPTTWRTCSECDRPVALFTWSGWTPGGSGR
jgi:hypothetical protein